MWFAEIYNFLLKGSLSVFLYQIYIFFKVTMKFVYFSFSFSFLLVIWVIILWLIFSILLRVSTMITFQLIYIIMCQLSYTILRRLHTMKVILPTMMIRFITIKVMRWVFPWNRILMPLKNFIAIPLKVMRWVFPWSRILTPLQNLIPIYTILRKGKKTLYYFYKYFIKS